MDYDVYKIEESADRTYFVFKSVGPKGTILKFVQFPENQDYVDHYNLVLGDIVDGRNRTDKPSDNGDVVKVMATVMLIIRRFLDYYPEASVVFWGSDPKRKHLYARTVIRHMQEFVPTYKLFGRIGGEFGKYTELTLTMANSVVIPEYDLFIISRVMVN